MGLWPRLHEAFWGSSKLPGLKTRLSDWYGTWLEPYLSVAGWCLAHMPDSTTCLFPDCRLGWGWWGTDVKCMRAKISLVMKMLRRNITQQMFMLCDRCTAYIIDVLKEEAFTQIVQAALVQGMPFSQEGANYKKCAKLNLVTCLGKLPQQQEGFCQGDLLLCLLVCSSDFICPPLQMWMSPARSHYCAKRFHAGSPTWRLHGCAKRSSRLNSACVLNCSQRGLRGDR